MITLEDLIERLMWMDCREVELVGEPKTFGHILVNNERRVGIYIFDESKIMDLLEEFMKVNAVKRKEFEQFFQGRT